MADPSSAPERYVPPSQRNQSARPTTGDRLDRTRSHETNVDDCNQPLATGDSSSRPITLKKCSGSEAYQLLSERWAAALRQYNDPTMDLSERPVMHYGGYVWGKLPHQIKASANNTLPTMSLEDYTNELRRGLLTPKFSNIKK